MADVFVFYAGEDCRYAEIEAIGDIDTDGKKRVTNKIRIIKEISMADAWKITNTGECNTGRRNTGDFNTGRWNTGSGNTGRWNTGSGNTGNYNTGSRNTGDWNTGDDNTGNWNTGNHNTGNWNTGDCNTGGYNTGDWNTTNYSTGCFCTKERTILMFDEPSNMTYSEWSHSQACKILHSMPQDINTTGWVSDSNMSEKEKADHPTYKTTGGYLKIIEGSSDKQKWWDELCEEDKATVKAIPNFNAEKFYQCTGVKV